MSVLPRDEVASAFPFSVFISLTRFSAGLWPFAALVLEAPCGLGCVEGPTGHRQVERFARNNPRMTVKR